MQDVIRGQNVDTDPSAYETEPSDLGVGISIQNLTKIYDTVREYHHLVCNVSLPAVFLHFTAIGLISCIVSVWLHCKYSSGLVYHIIYYTESCIIITIVYTER